jgi:hypothetical protein
MFGIGGAAVSRRVGVMQSKAEKTIRKNKTMIEI